jgi:hypothetical protein
MNIHTAWLRSSKKHLVTFVQLGILVVFLREREIKKSPWGICDVKIQVQTLELTLFV